MWNRTRRHAAPARCLCIEVDADTVFEAPAGPWRPGLPVRVGTLLAALSALVAVFILLPAFDRLPKPPAAPEWLGEQSALHAAPPGHGASDLGRDAERQGDAP